MVIYLIRHTKPDVPEETFYGQADVDVIKKNFVEQSARIQTKLPLEKTDLIISSPLQRCLKLAKEIQSNQKIDTDPRIKELNFGDWELKKWNSTDRTKMQEWTENFTKMPAPNGESHLQLYNRSVEFWNELLSKQLTTVGIITHAGVIRSLLAFMLDMPLEKSFSIKLHYGEMIYVEHILDHHYNIEFLKY
ncbi:MAG: alpha-ribazole phosphatase [Bacteroidales bacterium]